MTLGLTRLLIAGFVLFALSLGPASAQLITTPGSEAETSAETALPDPLTPEAIRELVSRLSDAEVRSLLLRQLDAASKEETESAEAQAVDVIGFVERSVIGVITSISEAVARAPRLLDGQIRSFSNFYAARGTDGTLAFFGILAAAIAVGLIAEFVVVRLARDWRARVQDVKEPEGLAEALKVLGLRLFLDIIGLIAFFVGMRVVTYTLTPPEDAPLLRLIIVNLIVFPRIMAAISRFLIAPNRPDLRLVHTDDWTARYLHRNQIGLVFLMGFSIAIVQFNALTGVPMGETRLGFWLNTAVHVYLCIIAFTARRGLAMMLMGREADVTPIEARVARAYPWFAFWLSIAVWVFVEILVANKMLHLLTGGRHYTTMFILLTAPALDTLIRGLVKHLSPPMTGEGELAEQAYTLTKRSYIRIGRVITFAIVLAIIADLWEIDFDNLASAGLGAQFAGRLFEVLLILALGYLALELVSLWINRKLAAEQTLAGIDLNAEEPGGGEGGGTGGSRLSTILPLMHGVARVAILIVFALIALGALGIDITPLLAGAGIAGLAIGFGAQKLVQDVVSGVFFLFDDAFRTGEFVDIEGTVGTVEKISIRSMQLRHHRGAVHTIPYGEIPKITNYSRDWVIMKLKFTVPFDTDINKVKKIFKQIGAEMLSDPMYADDLIQPFKSQGVFDVDDVGIVVRGKFMSKPGKQFTLRKEIYARVKSAFEANGISFARKEVRVAIPGLAEAESINDEQKSQIRAAAAGAAQGAEEETETPA